VKGTRSLATAEALTAIALWALSFILIKIALRELSPATLIVVRFGVAALVVGLAAGTRGSLPRVSRHDLVGLAVLGAIGVTLHQLLQVIGQTSTDAGMAALCAATAPAFIVVLAAVFLGERLGRWQLLGVLLAIAGAALVSVGGDWSSVRNARYMSLGNLLVLLSAMVWAASTIIGKHMMRKRSSSLITGGSLFFGWLFALPVFLAGKGWREIPGLSVRGWAAIVVLGVFCTAIAHLANNHALRHIPAQRIAVIQNLEPFLAVVGAWLILGEKMSAPMLAGGAAIIAGVYLTERFSAWAADQ